MNISLIMINNSAYFYKILSSMVNFLTFTFIEKFYIEMEEQLYYKLALK
jgi:hypothetical protein